MKNMETTQHLTDKFISLSEMGSQRSRPFTADQNTVDLSINRSGGKRKLWPSMAERVDAVDWDAITTNKIEYSSENINRMLARLGFPEVRGVYNGTWHVVTIYLATQRGIQRFDMPPHPRSCKKVVSHRY